MVDVNHTPIVLYSKVFFGGTDQKIASFAQRIWECYDAKNSGMSDRRSTPLSVDKGSIDFPAQSFSYTVSNTTSHLATGISLHESSKPRVVQIWCAAGTAFDRPYISCIPTNSLQETVEKYLERASRNVVQMEHAIREVKGNGALGKKHTELEVLVVGTDDQRVENVSDALRSGRVTPEDFLKKNRATARVVRDYFGAMTGDFGPVLDRHDLKEGMFDTVKIPLGTKPEGDDFVAVVSTALWYHELDGSREQHLGLAYAKRPDAIIPDGMIALRLAFDKRRELTSRLKRKSV